MSLLTTQWNGTEWKLAALGRHDLAATLVNLRGTIADREKVSAEDLFLVRIPALNLFFFGHEKNRDLILTPLANEPSLGLGRGVSTPASSLMPKLRTAASAAQRGGPS